MCVCVWMHIRTYIHAHHSYMHTHIILTPLYFKNLIWQMKELRNYCVAGNFSINGVVDIIFPIQ